MNPLEGKTRPACRTLGALLGTALAALALAPSLSWAQERVYFSAVHDIRNALVARINAETVRIDISAWYLTERAISIALVNRFRAGVDVRLIGDRVSIFEIDPLTRAEFYWLASHGVPIRLRYNPGRFPEIVHWKATIFVGQGMVAFGSANYTPFELAPASSSNYKDETVLFTDDPSLVEAFKSQFDRMWNDQVPEAESRAPRPPYFRNWDSACAAEPACADYRTLYPDRVPMIVDTRRLEGDAPIPPEMVWEQGASFNGRLAQEIRAERRRIDLVVYRLTVEDVTLALIEAHRSGVPVRVIVEPEEYLNRRWPEFWLTHANVDRLWAAGIRIKKRRHRGLTHMKMLVTSRVATVASSNFASNWQRDHNYFVPAATKPAIHRALADRFDDMWTDDGAFETFRPSSPDPAVLATPASGSANVSAGTALEWGAAPFATGYDVYVGTSPGDLRLAGSVPALLVDNPPPTYSFAPSLHGGTTYYWQVVSRTNASRAAPSLVGRSAVGRFTTVPVVMKWVASNAGGQVEPGRSITLTASGFSAGSGPLEYKFWARSERTGRWTVLRNYSPSTRFVWTPLEDDTYALQVWVRRAGSNAVYDDWRPFEPVAVGSHLAVTSVAPDIASPIPPGTEVSWTATATGARALEYRFWLYDSGAGRWSLLRDYSSSPSTLWRPAGDGVYWLQVWVRTRGSDAPWEAWMSSAPYRVASAAGAPATVAGIRSDRRFPVAVGTAVRLQAMAYGGSGSLLYKFWLYDMRRQAWTVLRDYAPAARATWTPQAAGTYSLQVWVRDSASLAAYDAWKPFGPVEVDDGSASVGDLAASTTNTSPGMEVTLTATATGSQAGVEYQFWLYEAGSGTWTIVQPYGPSSIVRWMPYAPGQYSAQVWVRRPGSTAAYEAWRASPTITVR